MSTSSWTMLAVALGLGGCAAATSEIHDPILGLSIHDSTLALSAIDTGCTKRFHFQFEIDRSVADATAVTVVRTTPDLCRKMPSAVTFHFAVEEVGLRREEKIRATNPVVSLKTPR